MSTLFNRITIIGVGLIGGSIARAARRAGLCNEIVGSARDQIALNTAKRLGVIDSAEIDVAKSVQGADLVIVAVPVGTMSTIFTKLSGVIGEQTILTDVGSSKQSVIDDATAAFEELPAGFVPAHPIAGTEKSGVEASFAELFENRCTILTPTPSSASWAVEKLTQFWEALGSEVVRMDAQHHDEVLAATSHVPHVLAFALVDTLGRMQESKEIFKYAAGGFRDFTRIASSDPEMWRDVCMHNSESIVHVLQLFRKELDTLETAVKNQDGEAIKTILQRAKNLRDTNVVV